MLNRVSKWILVLALTSSIGLHWALLQSVAWVGMLADNLQRTALPEAVCRTFDGQHPCCLCKAIAACKKTERKTELSFQVKKLEFLTQSQVPVPSAPTRFSFLRCQHTSAKTELRLPPIPPPRPYLG